MKSYEVIIEEYQESRHTNRYQVCPGITQIVMDAREKGLRQAVVSNNPTKEIELILGNVGLGGLFDFVVGNDVRTEGGELRKKPAPDTYLFAARQLGIASSQCVVIEDSLIGAAAGKAAGCFVVGVATGGATMKELGELGNKIDKVYQSFM